MQQIQIPHRQASSSRFDTFEPTARMVLSATAFAPYGWVIDGATARQGLRQPPVTINDGTCLRHDGLSPLQLTLDGGAPCLSLFSARSRSHDEFGRIPITLRWLERHRLGTQTFIPLNGARYWVVVALGDDEPDLHSLRAFEACRGEAVTLAAGTWHHGLIAPWGGDFVVIERQGSEPDCQVHTLNSAIQLYA